jgi:hypothetical protein
MVGAVPIEPKTPPPVRGEVAGLAKPIGVETADNDNFRGLGETTPYSQTQFVSPEMVAVTPVLPEVAILQIPMAVSIGRADACTGHLTCRHNRWSAPWCIKRLQRIPSIVDIE